VVRPRLAASAIAALAFGSLAVSASPQSVATASQPIGFEVPSVVDPIHTNGEPDIAVDRFGRVFVSGPTGTGTQRSTWFGSVDGGHTYRVMAQKTPPTSVTGIPGPQPGGGDTDINFDHTGKQYFADLYGLACVRTATTTDGGATDHENPNGCSTAFGADRQWLAVYDPPSGTSNESAYIGPKPLIYLEFNNLVSGATWLKSNTVVLPGDPGLTYTNAMTGVTPPVTTAMYSPFGADGYPAIDQVSGKVFQASGFQDSNGVWSLRMNVGTPDASGNLTFLDRPTTSNPNGNSGNLITIATGLADSPDTLFSVLSMDSGRNLFAVWAISDSTSAQTKPAQRQVFVSTASAATGWTVWSAPVQVSNGSTATGDATNVFPWIKAGGPGRADAVWYGSDLQVNPSSHSNQTWNAFMSQVVFSTDAAGHVQTGASPSTALVKVSPHPMHYDDICLSGSTCILSTGNRNLADFFEVNIDRSGAAEVVYDDTSNGLVQPPNLCSAQAVDHCGAGVISVARQSSGMGLFGYPVTGPSNSPVGGMTDPAGDALYPVIGGGRQTGMDIRSSQLQLSPDGQYITAIVQVGDLSNPAATLASLSQAGSTNVQYVTRWQMGNTIYYAAMENTALNQPSFYAGAAQSIDLCSVSACFPHVLTYPEPGGATFTGKQETGTITCPVSPSASNPCTLAIKVHVADVGSPTANSLLEEVGSYPLAASTLEGAETNPTAESDTVPLEIDGACCYNFKASVQNGLPGPCHEGDGDGDISDGRGGKAHIHFDQDACEDANPESIQERDSSTGDNFQSNSVTAISFNDALSNVTIAGTGTHNGNPVTFTLIAVNGGAGIGAATLILSDGYAVSGTMLNGSIQLQ
jgi:hypothetical protein